MGCPPSWRVPLVWRAYRGNDDTRQNIPWGGCRVGCGALYVGGNFGRIWLIKTGSAALRSSPGPVLIFLRTSEGLHVSQPAKNFKSHGQQIELLRSRGMHIGDEAAGWGFHLSDSHRTGISFDLGARAWTRRSPDPFETRPAWSCSQRSLPIWAAVEVIDWGAVSYLYQLAPRANSALVTQQLCPPY